MRTIVVGDVHGMLGELKELLASVQFKKGEDRLVFVGDLLDRGPDSAGCVRLAKDLDAIVTIGNHEEKYVRWFKHEDIKRRTGKPNPMDFGERKVAIAATLTPEDLEFIQTWPLYYYLDDKHVVVHAGFEPGIPVRKQLPNICLRMRYVTPDGKYDKKAVDEPSPGSVYWSAVWTGPENVIYGHAVHGLEEPRIDHPAPGVTTYGIDTGGCFGGKLTAMMLEPGKEHRFASVKAYRQYAKLRPMKRA